MQNLLFHEGTCRFRRDSAYCEVGEMVDGRKAAGLPFRRIPIVLMKGVTNLQ